MKRTLPIGLIVAFSLLGVHGPLTAAAFAATAVDIYQDMESGANGDVLTPALMNASHHGGGDVEHRQGRDCGCPPPRQGICRDR